MMDNEKDLLKRLAEGDEDAFHRIFNYYYPRTMVFLSRMIADREDVRDMAQNIFIRIWLMRSMLPEIHSFGAYLYRMSRNAAIDYTRSRGVTIPVPEEYDDISSGPPDRQYIAHETQYRISKSVGEMPPKRRRIFIMSRVEGLSNAEIAERLNISPKTVENQIALALRQLRNIVSILSILVINLVK